MEIMKYKSNRVYHTYNKVHHNIKSFGKAVDQFQTLNINIKVNTARVEKTRGS